MLMTENEAAEKWCPQVRIARREEFTYETARTGGDQPLIAMRTDHSVVAGCNTDALGGTRVPSPCRCIGSQCAMWRWDGTTPIRYIKIASNRKAMSEAEAGDLVKSPPPLGWRFIPYNEHEGDPAGWEETEELAHSRRKGYCGLAGRPGVE